MVLIAEARQRRMEQFDPERATLTDADDPLMVDEEDAYTPRFVSKATGLGAVVVPATDACAAAEHAEQVAAHAAGEAKELARLEGGTLGTKKLGKLLNKISFSGGGPAATAVAPLPQDS